MCPTGKRIAAANEDQRVDNYTAQTDVSTPEHPFDRKCDGNAQNPRVVCVGRDLKAHFTPTPCLPPDLSSIQPDPFQPKPIWDPMVSIQFTPITAEGTCLSVCLSVL